jgi:hypothetical protein
MTPALLQAAINFLETDHARNPLGLHRQRVGGDMCDRGGVAKLLRAELRGVDGTAASKRAPTEWPYPYSARGGYQHPLPLIDKERDGPEIPGFADGYDNA